MMPSSKPEDLPQGARFFRQLHFGVTRSYPASNMRNGFKSTS